MRRFVSLAFLLLFALPFGVSISGCGRKGAAAVYCNGGDSGPVVGQVTNITLLPRIYGVSLNQGQIGQVATPTATDCQGNSVTVNSYTYGVFDANGRATTTTADVVPTGTNAGRLCGGNWNRNSGAGVPDFTTCNSTGITGQVYVVASGGGASSNPLPIFVHPTVSSIVLGSPSTDCTNDPTSNCCPLAAQATVTATPYTGASCISQGRTAQLVARAFSANGANITCSVGHLTYAAATSTIATIDENGVITAQQPGSTVITSSLTQTGSSAGFFSTCPPTNIALRVPNTTTGTSTSVTVNQNTTQPLSAVATDINNVTLTGLTLDFVSTNPIEIPAVATGSVTPAYPASASITAICQPPNCNQAPVNQIGLFGNGKPVASNAVRVTTPGSSTAQIWVGSTQSRYIYPVDFTNITNSTAVRLPFAPNSMVLSNDGASIYMGTANELMVFNAATNSLTSEFNTVAGKVLAISPDGTKLIMSDPRRNFTYVLTASTGAIISTYGGVGTRAAFTQDNNTAYITMGTPDANFNVTPNNQLLVYSSFTGWSQVTLGAPATDLTITVPSVGAYLAGASTTARSYCASTTITGTPPNTTSITNVPYPLADTATVATDRVQATNDGLHILGATAAAGGTVVDLGLTATTTTGLPLGQCPTVVPPNYFTSYRGTTNSLPLGVTATAITGIVPTSNSQTAFITYMGSGSLPVYRPAAGTLSQVALVNNATAPVAAAISSDGSTLYVGTSGDNQIHLINTNTLTDDASRLIAPRLPLYVNGTDGTSIVTPDLIVQHVRRTTS